VERPKVAVAGDFLNCWGEDRGPWGEKAAVTEKGVETEGVAAAPCWACEGVLPCDSGYLPGVGVDMAVGDCLWYLTGGGYWRKNVECETMLI
jgi:hypothetical protein